MNSQKEQSLSFRVYWSLGSIGYSEYVRHWDGVNFNFLWDVAGMFVGGDGVFESWARRINSLFYVICTMGSVECCFNHNMCYLME